MNNILVSVIIPTYNDWDRLELCLNALTNQSLEQSCFEIIVIDNNPSITTPKQITVPFNCIMVSEAKPGSYAARNRGIGLAKGDILAFTDSDCIPDRNWLKNGLGLLKDNPEFSRVAGHITLFYKQDNSRNLAEIYESVYAFRQDIAAKLGESVTGNMFCYSYLFDAIHVGLFNEKMFSGGDYEWSVRAKEKGYRILYGKESIINHPARDNFNELAVKSRRIAGTIVNENNKVIALLKLLFPPIIGFKKYNRRPIYNRIVALGIKYYLNLLRFIEAFKILVGKKPNRA